MTNKLFLSWSYWWLERHIKQNENGWKFKTYKGTNLFYNMLCESVKYDKEEKEGYLLIVNRAINLNSLITYIDTFLVCKKCSQERTKQKKYKRENIRKLCCLF